jgi:hypothetical protein
VLLAVSLVQNDFSTKQKPRFWRNVANKLRYVAHHDFSQSNPYLAALNRQKGIREKSKNEV